MKVLQKNICVICVKMNYYFVSVILLKDQSGW
jgi:hypothetical protein